MVTFNEAVSLTCVIVSVQLASAYYAHRRSLIGTRDSVRAMDTVRNGLHDCRDILAVIKLWVDIATRKERTAIEAAEKTTAAANKIEQLQKSHH